MISTIVLIITIIIALIAPTIVVFAAAGLAIGRSQRYDTIVDIAMAITLHTAQTTGVSHRY